MVLMAALALVKVEPQMLLKTKVAIILACATLPVSSVWAQAAPASCAEYSTLDTDGNGRLSVAEAASAHARARVDNITIDADGLTAEQYAQICQAEHWSARTPEEGAPFEGANSFTEEQARDRAVAWDFTDVSALTKDDKGIWRGTAKQGANSVSIAIDYKGNVVAAAQ